jgi:high mobility group protein B2
LFTQENRPSVAESNPEWTRQEVTEELKKSWNTLPSKERQKYKKLAEKDKRRYHEESTVYEAGGNASGGEDQASRSEADDSLSESGE